MTEEAKCIYCGKEFKKESTIISHMCEKKKRWMWKDEKYVILAFMAYRRFYEVNMNSKKKRTYEDFVESKFYNGFTDFTSNLLKKDHIIDPSGFIDFLLKSGIPLSKWSNDIIYEEWVRELSKRESPEKAMERMILVMEQWANNHDDHWTNFFKNISTGLAVHYLRIGKISPWILYTADTAILLLERFTEEQIGMIEQYIDPKFWSHKIEEYNAEVNNIKEILRDAGV